MSPYSAALRVRARMKFRRRPRRSCPKVSTHCCLGPTGMRSVWEGIGRRGRSKSYGEQSCFNYSVVRLQWYSSCTYVVTDRCRTDTPITQSLGGRTMALWRRLWNFRRWKKATTPMLLNADTGELLPLSTHTAPPDGKWLLRRPLTLPGSPVPLFLEVRGIPERKKRRAEPSAASVRTTAS